MNQSERATPTRPLFTRRSIVLSLLVVFALVLFVWGLNIGRNTDKPPTFTDSAVEGTSPNPGDLALRQDRIGVDLVAGYKATLRVDNIPIPDDQVEFVVGLDQYWYQPGPGTETGALSPGRHCAVATITKATDPSDTGHPFSWCWQVH